MAEETLVEDISGGRRDPLVEQGAHLLELLDEDGIPITAALWLLDPESHTWKYVLASPLVNTDGPLQLYKRLQDPVRQVGLTLQDIAVVSPQDSLVELFRAKMRTSPTAIMGLRVTGNSINNVFIDDAYIYRAA